MKVLGFIAFGLLCGCVGWGFALLAYGQRREMALDDEEVERRTRPDAAPLRWNETGDVVETWSTFNVPTTTLRSVN